MFVILMGVSGCGKTTIGKDVAETLGIPFYDGDDFHPQENIDKMAAGFPLNDEDRAGWLDKIRELIEKSLKTGRSGIIACSALKQKYRDRLRVEKEKVVFVYLKGSFELIFERMRARDGHYMKASMLKSQFDTLEEPRDAYTVDIAQTPEEITIAVSKYLREYFA